MPSRPRQCHFPTCVGGHEQVIKGPGRVEPLCDSVCLNRCQPHLPCISDRLVEDLC